MQSHKRVLLFLERNFSIIVQIFILAIVVILLILNAFVGHIGKQDQNILLTLTVSVVLGLIIIIYLDIKKILRTTERLDPNIIFSGISDCYDHLNSSNFKRVIKKQKHIIIVNTFFHNFSHVKATLTEAIEEYNCQVEIYVPNNESEYLKLRASELPSKSFEGALELSYNTLSAYLKSLPEKYKNNVIIYEHDKPLKFSIYGSKESALIGFYWPNKDALAAPNILIKGVKRGFAGAVWEYFDNLSSNRKNITSIVRDTPEALMQTVSE